MKTGALRWVLLVAAVSVLAACGRQEPPAEVVRPVIVHRVSMAATASGSTYAGEVRARYEADLAFRIPGKIVERPVDVGRTVRKGQVLARVDPADVALQADAAQASLSAADTEYELARAELDRYRDLFQRRFVSQSALDQKQAAFDSAQARLAQARAQLAVSRNQATYATLAAPAGGVVTAVGAEVGQVVAAGQAVVRVAHLGEREVAISVPENRIAELRRSAEVAIALWASPGRTYRGRVREVSASVDATTRTFAVRVAFADPDDAVQLGMTANVFVAADGGPSGAIVPATAIYHADQNPAVWVFDLASGKVNLRRVTLGPFREDGVVVLAGVEDGELIVAAGVNKLTAGQSVRLFEGTPSRSANAANPS